MIEDSKKDLNISNHLDNLSDIDKQLIEKAYEVMHNAYAPYSNFKVGAALLGKNGIIYTGCNVENASYGATNCAERTAIFKAVSEGIKEFDKLAIVSSSDEFTYPCGICRQVMTEFMHSGEVIFSNKGGYVKKIKISELFPYKFEL
jgi:cytidine deaminase